MSGGGILTIADRGGGNARLIPHGGAIVSWVTNEPGSFSAYIPADVARSYGLIGGNAAGTIWIRYQYPDLPDWGGVATVPQWADGFYELGAEQFHVLLRRRRVNRLYGQQSATAGALAQRALRDAWADDAIMLTEVQADEWGDPVAYEWRGGDLEEDIFRELAEASGQEWTVDADRRLDWRVRLGTDKTGTVMLYQPHEITSCRYATDLWTTANEVMGIAADSRYERSAHAIQSHTTSIRTLGRYQVTNRYPGVVNRGTIVPKVRRDLEQTAWPAEVMVLTVANVGRCWSRYHVGDSISVTLPEAGVVRRVRIGARSVDIDAGLETLGVEVEHERDGWT
jgi:hypothetical protein